MIVTLTEFYRLMNELYRWYSTHMTLQVNTAFISIYLQYLTAITSCLIHIFNLFPEGLDQMKHNVHNSSTNVLFL